MKHLQFYSNLYKTAGFAPSQHFGHKGPSKNKYLLSALCSAEIMKCERQNLDIYMYVGPSELLSFTKSSLQCWNFTEVFFVTHLASKKQPLVIPNSSSVPYI